MKRVSVLDSTLRDGAQGEGIHYSVEDKINIVKALDFAGIDYIEAGNPGSNPKDMEFFERVKSLRLKYARLAAFGPTRKVGARVEEDEGCRALILAGTDTVCIFGKSWDFQVQEVLRTTLQENLEMIRDTVGYFASHGKTVFFDAEHFFDGYKENPEYALSCLKTAEEAGAALLVLCDTNGGVFPDEAGRIIAEVREKVRVPLGIHAHDDMGCAVALSIQAVQAGAAQVQGTFLGFGERCGNANLSAVIPSLQMKLGYRCVPEEKLTQLTHTARYLAEITNYILPRGMPYVGKSAFAHKGGMHVDGVMKNPRSFEHIPPEAVGNRRNILLSEVSGRTALLGKIQAIDPGQTKESPATIRALQAVKDLEHRGYQFESAGASLEILLYKQLGLFTSFFELEHFKIIGEQFASGQDHPSAAMVKVRVGAKEEITAAEGVGPVDALDKALRKALEVFYPALSNMRLIDYKVRVIEPRDATAAVVRVLIESTDGRQVWTTVGVSQDIIRASWLALVDSIEYKLLQDTGRDWKS